MAPVRPAPRPRARAPIRVIIADRHRTFADALRIALSQAGALRVTAVTHEADALAETVRSRGADVVLIDEDLPADGTAWAVKDVAPTARVLALTGTEDQAAVVRAAEGGADAVLPRTRSLRDVVRAIQALSRGDSLIDPEIARRSAVRRRRRREDHAALADRLDRLTSRELEILQHMADGLRPEEIAERLGISPNTLRTHVQNVLMKLRVHSKLQAVTAAIRHGRVHVRPEVTVDVERRVLDLTVSGSRGAAYAGGTSGSTSSGRSGRGRSRGSSR